MPLNETSGNLTTDAFGGGVAVVPTYIEEVFSTYLYDGNGTTQQIVNGIDLSTKGGMVWTKSRSNAFNNTIIDTARTSQYLLYTNTSGAQANQGATIADFNTNGYTFTASGNPWNTNNYTHNAYVGWTFRKQPKFFDVVTYTGTGSAQNIAHNLGSVPGCVIVKSTSNTSQWYTYHISTGNTGGMFLSLSNAFTTSSSYWDNTDPTSTQFTVGTGGTNNSGQTYVAYIFAHNAGGFGLTGTDNVITCGSMTMDGSGSATVNLGYEPQFILAKQSSGAENWFIFDTMRGWAFNGTELLNPNLSGAAYNYGSTDVGKPTATGFNINYFTAGATYIYIAIRRGPMKIPTDATKVFSPVTQTDGGTVTTNFPVDLTINGDRPSSWVPNWFDRLRGGSSNTYAILNSASTNAEAAGSGTGSMGFQNNTGYKDYWNNSGLSAIYWSFRRAPSFFDEVCYTGTGSANRQITHNLGVSPEFIIVKSRTNTRNWRCLYSANGSNGVLNLDDAFDTAITPVYFGDGTTYISPTATNFTVGNAFDTNGGTQTYVAYLFATCTGVSKVGNYTGTGATQTINCGFTGGARFVLVKRTDSTGDWYVWDTARGMVSGTDPSLLLNSTAAEVNANSIYTATTGFQIVSTAAGINASGGSYIYFSVA